MGNNKAHAMARTTEFAAVTTIQAQVRSRNCRRKIRKIRKLRKLLAAVKIQRCYRNFRFGAACDRVPNALKSITRRDGEALVPQKQDTLKNSQSKVKRRHRKKATTKFYITAESQRDKNGICRKPPSTQRDKNSANYRERRLMNSQSDDDVEVDAVICPGALELTQRAAGFGDAKDADTLNVVRVSHFKSVRNVGTRGKKGTSFSGAIVSYLDSNRCRRMKAVEKKRFMTDANCFASLNEHAMGIGFNFHCSSKSGDIEGMSVVQCAATAEFKVVPSSCVFDPSDHSWGRHAKRTKVQKPPVVEDDDVDAIFKSFRDPSFPVSLLPAVFKNAVLEREEVSAARDRERCFREELDEDMKKAEANLKMAMRDAFRKAKDTLNLTNQDEAQYIPKGAVGEKHVALLTDLTNRVVGDGRWSFEFAEGLIAAIKEKKHALARLANKTDDHAVTHISLVEELIVSRVKKVERAPKRRVSRSTCLKEGCGTLSHPSAGKYCSKHNDKKRKCREPGCLYLSYRSCGLCTSHFKKNIGRLKSEGIDVEEQKCSFCAHGSPREVGGRCRDCIERARLV